MFRNTCKIFNGKKNQENIVENVVCEMEAILFHASMNRVIIDSDKDMSPVRGMTLPKPLLTYSEC